MAKTQERMAEGGTRYMRPGSLVGSWSRRLVDGLVPTNRCKSFCTGQPDPDPGVLRAGFADAAAAAAAGVDARVPWTMIQ